MYCEFFNLSGKPFSLAADPRYLYMSRQHWEAMAHLMHGVDDDWGFVLITGEIGAGKTTLCRFLIDQMPDDVETAFIINPKLTVDELLDSVCHEFGISNAPGRAAARESFDLISRYLLEIHAKGKKALLIIDEAQYLSAEVLDQLRLLTNLETDDCKLLRIILIGQPELNDKLSQPELEQMSQRITARYHLGPLSKKDVALYVAHRMKVAGAAGDMFSKAAIRELIRLSRGIPRLINLICDRALLGSCMKKERIVKRSTLIEAANEVFRGAGFSRRRLNMPDMGWAAAGLLTGMIVTAILLWYFGMPAESPVSGPNPASYTGAAAVADRQKSPDWWPPLIPTAQSREAAQRVLGWEKGVSYYSSNSSDESTFCENIELLGMRCISRKESDHDLSLLPVPSMIRLSDNMGSTSYAVLKSVKDDKVRLMIGDTDIEIPAGRIKTLWSGDYMLIEKTESAKKIGASNKTAGRAGRK